MTLFEEIFLDIEGEQEITPIQIKENKGRVFTDFSRSLDGADLTRENPKYR